MRRAICSLPEGGTISAHIDESGRTFQRGDAVDLDAIAVAARGDRKAETWADVLGTHVEHFDLETPSPGVEVPDMAAGDHEE